MNDNVDISQIRNLKLGQSCKIAGVKITYDLQFKSHVFKGRGSKTILKKFIESNGRFVQILDAKGYRQFLPISTWKLFWQKCASISICDRYIYEVIQSNLPCKPYLDIEWKKINDSENGSSFISILTTDLIDIFEHRYNITLTSDDILISTSHSPTKMSFHVIIDKTCNDGSKLVFATNRRIGNTNPSTAWDLCTSLLRKRKLFYENKLDDSVYSLDREFRALFSNKKPGDYRPVVPINIDLDSISPNDTNWLRYIVTNIDMDNCRYINPPQNTESIIFMKNKMIAPTKNNHKLANIDNKLILKYTELAKKFHPTSFFTGCSNDKYILWFRFSYSDKTEPCFTGEYHDSNGFYIFDDIDSDGNYVTKIRCLSEKCKHQSQILIKKHITFF